MSKINRKSLALILVAVLCIGIAAGCAPPAATPDVPVAPAPTAPTPAAPAPGQGGFTVEAAPPAQGANLATHIDITGDQSDVTVLNPVLAGATGTSAWIMGMITDRLIEIYGPGDYRPGLALNWETEDFQTIRLHLRQGVTWHNGDPFNAECVAFTIEVALDNPGGTSWTRLRTIESWNIIDDYTIDIVYADKNVDFEFDLSHWAVGILNRREFAERPDDPLWATVGTGPFRLTGFQAANFASIERFDDYWGELPPTQSMTFWTIPEMATRMAMVQNGELQVSFSLNPEDLDIMLDNPNFEMIKDVLHAPNMLAFNNQGDEIMMDTNFRLAVAHAINLEDLAIVASGNWATAWPNGNLWGMSTPFYRTDLPRREFDPELARQYLEQSVYNGETIELVAVPGGGARAAEMVQLQLGQIGIDIAINVMDVPSYVAAFAYGEEVQRGRQMSLFVKGFGPTAVGARALLYPGAVTNRINLNSDYVSERFDQLSIETDPAVSQRLAEEIQGWMWEHLVAIPTHQTITGIVVAPGVGGMHLWGDNFRYNLRGLYWDLNQMP